MFFPFLMMFYAKLGARPNGSRLFKFATTSALALSALAGGVMLSGGQVKASTTTCTPIPMAVTPIVNPFGQDCTTFDPALPGTFTNNAKVIDAGGLPAFTQISLEGTGLNYPFAQQQIDTDFNTNGPLGGGNYAGGLISSVYRAEAKTPGFFFDGIDLAAAGIGNFTVKKELFSDAALTTPIKDRLENPIVLNLTGAGFVPIVDLPTRPSVIYIRDTFNNPVLGQSSIDNAQNTLRNVPGPLPILGAGAAFGFSRKLRGRIKAARTA